ncbi:carbohydrate binding domain-containing protein [Robertkochia solimangrovi]|uniref:carbohydrate binding domain-containing protein n=1 Tax=Robertkochia solimangrovi TaxID=2213046 RepID=UPI0011801E5F|nr:carbohydrate binding domain-containing protein [Robertkochia solimangrovi]TRZ42496.1 hypothetical protein DMZ48_13415 [Robertkochia solimangrovi]
MNRLLITISTLCFSLILLMLGGCKNDDDFTEVSIGDINPNPAFTGDLVTVTGSNFQSVQFVFVGEKDVAYTLENDVISFYVPEESPAGDLDLTLVMADNYRVRSKIMVEQKPIPLIRRISPSAVGPGNEVTIAGVSLDNNTSVLIGGMPATISSNNGSEMKVVVPTGLTPYQQAEIEITTDFGMAVSESIFFAGDNLLPNGELEDGAGDDFTSWEKLNGGDGMTAVTGDAAYYNRSIRVVGAASDAWRTQFASQHLPLVPGTTYTLMLWAKGEQDGAIMRTSVSQYPEDYFYGDDTELSTEWAQYSWTFTAQELPNGSRIVLDMGHTNVPFVIDNITLVEGEGGSTGAAELLPDGSFENGVYPNGSPDGVASWQVLNGDIQITSVDPYCGSQAIVAVGAGANPWDTQLAADGIILEEDKMYEVQFAAKAEGEGGIMRMSMSRWASGQSDDYFYSPDINLTTDWTIYSFVVTAGATSTGDHNIVLDMGASAQTIHVDAISVKEYVPQVNILPDGGFENGIYPNSTPDGVATWQQLNGDIQVTTSEVYEGSNAMVAVGAGGNPWDTQMAADGVTLEEGKQYKISMWAKAAGEDGVMRVSISRWASGQSDDYFYGHDVTIAQDWTYYAWTFTAGTTSTGTHNVVLDMGTTTQTFYIDNVTLSELPDPCD